MAQNLDFNDFYIIYTGDPAYTPNELVEDDVISIIIQKFKMIIFTNQGEVNGDPFFGGNLLELLYTTKVSAQTVQTNLTQQINLYIPEIQNTAYTLNVQFVQDNNTLTEVMFIYFQIQDYEVYAQIGKFINQSPT